MNHYPFTLGLESEAKAFLANWNNPKAHGIKCWYCDAGNVENSGDILLIGLNPGGGEDSKGIDDKYDYLKLPYTKEGFNSWLDEYWPGNGRKHQKAMSRVFRTMFSNAWERKLRSSICTNVFPIRTKDVTDIDDDGWEFAEKWFQKIMAHVQPRIIICNGNNNQNSAWSYLCQHFGCSLEKQIDIGARGSVKQGSFSSNAGKCKVLGLPLLSRFSRESLYQAIDDLGPF